jgi:[protein-PII] uridylyltransferase
MSFAGSPAPLLFPSPFRTLYFNMKSTYIHDYHADYKRSVETIHTLHATGADGITIATSLTAEVDSFLQNLFDLLDASLKEPVTVLALGGYGRCELAPFSDIDLLILYRDTKTRAGAEHTSMAFLHLLYDAGFTVGHAFRSFDEMLATQHTDYDSWAAMLEARFLCGNEELYNEFAGLVNRRQEANKDLGFIRHVIDQRGHRHAKYGNSIKLLEPNIKQSAGGLRDIHMLLWISRSLQAYPLRSYSDTSERYRSACLQLFEDLHDMRQIDRQTCDRLEQSFAYLLRVRHQLHLLAGNLHDTLEFGIQEKVAAKLGYADTDTKKAVELFMRDYYMQVREIKRFNESLVQTYRELYRPAKRRRTNIVQLDDRYTVEGNRIGITDDRPDPFVPDAYHILSVFVYQSKHGLPLDNRVRKHILENLHCIDRSAQHDEKAGEMFAAILHGRHPGSAVRSMHDLGVLERLISEFNELVAFFQHNQYHYYTADEHTVIALEKLEALKDDGRLLGDIYRRLPDKEPLYLAALLHDIAKPRRVIDHEIIGADMAEEILTRLGRTNHLEDVQFLIRHHLMMEQVAFRRNIYESETIEEFASRFNTRSQLDMLYLLTYADLSAVNPKVWTDWKNQLLQDLYIRTDDELSRHREDLNRIDRYRSSVNQIVEKISGYLPEDSIREHISQFDDRSYIASFSDKEISQHIESIQRNHRGRAAVTMHHTHHRGFTELTIITHDQPYALSNFCGILTVNDANIIDANIFTRADGIIIDKFRVVDFISNKSLTDEKCHAIKRHLDELAGNKLSDIQELIERQRLKWKRKHAKRGKPDTAFQVTIRRDTASHDHRCVRTRCDRHAVSDHPDALELRLEYLFCQDRNARRRCGRLLLRAVVRQQEDPVR